MKTEMKIDHIGIAVKSLSEAVPKFEKIFNAKASEMEYVEDQKVKVQKIKIDNMDIELLEGTAPESPISKFIEKKGEGIHHCSFHVDDIMSKLSSLKNDGIQLIDETPRTGADDMLIAFLHPKSTGSVLMELSQEKS